MQKRRAHTKSRRGCLPCKSRHVKCDEQTPICAGCLARKTDCIYPASSKSPPPVEDASGGAQWSDGPEDASSVSLTTLVGNPSDAGASPGGSSSGGGGGRATGAAAQRLLELELMHRWSSYTYKTVSTTSADEWLMQLVMPRAALRHGYMMDGILAVAALDIATAIVSSAEPAELGEDPVTAERYYQAALEYYARGIAAFRAALDEPVTPDNHTSLYIFSILAVILNMVMPERLRVGRLEVKAEDYEESVLERMGLCFDLFIGVGSIALIDYRSLIEDSPLSRSIKAMPGFADVNDVSEGVTEAFVRLHRINDEANPVPMLDMIHTQMRKEGNVDIAVSSPKMHEACRVSIQYLKYFYAEHKRAVMRGFCTCWPITGGKAFSTAVKERQPVPLCIVMHWGVLVDWFASNDDMAWYVAGTGRKLVDEISQLLHANTQLSHIPGWKESIAWSREQVGLPELLDLVVL